MFVKIKQYCYLFLKISNDEKYVYFLVCYTDLGYVFLGLPDSFLFDLKLDCAKYSVTQGNTVLNQCITRDKIRSVYVNVKNNYPRVQPIYRDVISPHSFDKINSENSKLLGEINSIENVTLRDIIIDYLDIYFLKYDVGKRNIESQRIF